MGSRVEVLDGESIEKALHRLRVKQAYEYKRWTKKRYGYFEKPSALRRKQQKMAQLWSILGKFSGRSGKNAIHLYIGLEELFARSGPNAAGK